MCLMLYTTIKKTGVSTIPISNKSFEHFIYHKILKNTYNNLSHVYSSTTVISFIQLVSVEFFFNSLEM